MTRRAVRDDVLVDKSPVRPPSPKQSTDSDREIGARIRSLRKVTNLSQTALATELGVTFQQVQKYENGTNRLSATRLKQIAALFDVSIDALSGASTFGDGERDGLATTFLASVGSAGLMEAWLALDEDRRRLAVRLVGELGRGGTPER